jgi:hypothetical protein
VTECAGDSNRPPGQRWKGSVICVLGEMIVRRAWHVREIKGE